MTGPRSCKCEKDEKRRNRSATDLRFSESGPRRCRWHLKCSHHVGWAQDDWTGQRQPIAVQVDFSKTQDGTYDVTVGSGDRQFDKTTRVYVQEGKAARREGELPKLSN